MFAPPVAAERIGKFVADRTNPRPVRLVFSSLIYKHSFLEFSKDFRQAGFRLDDDLTKSQQAERKSLSLDFQTLKTKGYQPYFRGSLEAVLQRQQKPHMCEEKSRQNTSSCMNVAVTHEPYYDMVYACGHIPGLQTSCKVLLISDKLSVYKSVNDDFHVDMLIVTVVSDAWCPAKRLLFVANLCTSQAR